ncbi:MAG: methyltransferase domain-containing protein [bacterium]|nr:methyltransferase domain-containing protein [bacterium]
MTKTIWNTGKLLKLSGTFWETCVLQTSVKLDIFTVLGDTPLTCRELSERIAVPVDGLERLLNALTGMKLLIKTKDNFGNTKESRDLLSRDSENYTGFLIRHHQNLAKTWSRLDEALISGKPFRPNAEALTTDQTESFLMGMHNGATLNAPLLIDSVPLAQSRRLLDLGGGPGTFSIHFCKRFPQLKASIFDLPTSRTFAQKNIDKNELTERIDFLPGNFNTSPIPGKYDTAWLSHVLHGEGDGNCRNMIKKTADALEPGGTIIIHEFILENNRVEPFFPALFSLNMFLHTAQGRSYTIAELTSMLEDGGFKDIRHIPLRTPTKSSLLTAVK